jgi:hypothetical protein
MNRRHPFRPLAVSALAAALWLAALIWTGVV